MKNLNVFNPIVDDIDVICSNLGGESSSFDGFPPILVFGPPKSGKTTVVEKIIGSELGFLPSSQKKGIISTRRPIEITLRNSPTSGFESRIEDEYCDRQKIKYRKQPRSFEDVKYVLTDIMKKSCPGYMIIQDPIKIKITSRDIMNNLRIIDTPPIISKPIGGQPKNINSLTNRIIDTYAFEDEALLISVDKSNDEFSESIETVKKSRMIDPQQRRSIFVISELDKTKRSLQKKVLKTLYGKKVNIEKDQICGLISRDVSEKEYFTKNKEIYRSSVLRNRLGYNSLRRNIGIYFLEHCQDFLKVYDRKLDDLLLTAQERIESYGDPPSTYRKDRILIMESFVFETMYAVEGALNGTYIFKDGKEKFGGVKIRDIFAERFTKEMDMKDPLGGLTDSDISMRIWSARGTKCVLFTPQSAFEGLVKNRISSLLGPSCMFCVDLVGFELKDIVKQITSFLSKNKLNLLKEKLEKFLSKIISKCTKRCKVMINNQIQMELGFINTNHPHFSKILKLIQKKYKDNESMTREQMDIESFRLMLDCYFDIVRKNFTDSVQKSVMHMVVNKFVKLMREDTILQFLQSHYNDVMELTMEDPQVQKIRERTKKMFLVFQETKKKCNLILKKSIDKL